MFARLLSTAVFLTLLEPLQAVAFDCYQSQPYIEHRTRSSTAFNEMLATQNRTKDLLRKQGLSDEQVEARLKQIPKTPAEESLQNRLLVMAERIVEVTDQPEQLPSSCSHLIELETEFGRLLNEHANSRFRTVGEYVATSPKPTH